MGVGWIVRQKKSKALSECNVKGAKSYSVTFNCSNPKEEMIAKKLSFEGITGSVHRAKSLVSFN